MYIQYTKIRNVSSPFKAYPHDPGYDIYTPRDFSSTAIRLGEFLRIPTGLRLLIPNGFFIHILSRSSSTANGIMCQGIIDPGYEGELHIDIWGVSNTPVVIKADARIAQMLPIVTAPIYNVVTSAGYDTTEPMLYNSRYRVEPIRLLEISQDKFSSLCCSVRGTSGLGSSNT